MGEIKIIEFSQIKKQLMDLNEVKAIISPTKDTGFPEKMVTLADQVSKNEITGKKEKTVVEVPLKMKVVVYEDDQRVRDKIRKVIGTIPYEVVVLSR